MFESISHRGSVREREREREFFEDFYINKILCLVLFLHIYIYTILLCSFDIRRVKRKTT